MQADTVFDRLVRDLSRDERKKMLDKIGKLSSESWEPLAEEEPEKPLLDLEQAFLNLGFFTRLLIFFKTFILGRSREDVLMDRLLDDVAREVNRRRSGLLDSSKKMINPGFVDELKTLKAAVVVFVPVLNRIFGRQRADFVAFLAGLEMDDAITRLMEETDPQRLAEKFLAQSDSPFPGPEDEKPRRPSSQELSDGELRKMMENSLEDVLQFLPSPGKTAMYKNMKLLHCLQALASFPFDRLISSFEAVPDLPATAVPISRIKDFVIRLAEIMNSMKVAPSPALLKGMFLFLNEEKSKKAGFNIEEELDRQMRTADKALAKIRHLNKTFPFVLLARFSSGDINYICEDIGGGEDWLALLRQFWRGRIDIVHRVFVGERKREELLTEIRQILEPAPFTNVTGYFFPGDDGQNHGTYWLSLGFLKTFFAKIFPTEFNRHLKILLIEGEFYKDDNRQEFTEAYSLLLKVGETLDAFEGKLKPEGEYGEILRTTKNDLLPEETKRKEIEKIIKIMDREVESMIADVRKGFTVLGKILSGILYGEIGGRYDTLSNLSYLGGKANKSFLKGLDDIMNRSKTLGSLVEKAFLIEGGRK